MDKHSQILALAEEVRETRDVKEVMQMLSSGNWVAICATKEEHPLFVLERVG